MAHTEVECAQKKKVLEDQLVLVAEWWGTTSEKCRSEMVKSLLMPNKCPVCTIKSMVKDNDKLMFERDAFACELKSVTKEKEVLSAKLAVYEEEDRKRAENKRIWEEEEKKKQVVTCNPGMGPEQGYCVHGYRTVGGNCCHLPRNDCNIVEHRFTQQQLEGIRADLEWREGCERLGWGQM